MFSTQISPASVSKRFSPPLPSDVYIVYFISGSNLKWNRTVLVLMGLSRRFTYRIQIHSPTEQRWISIEKEVDGSGRFFWASDVFGKICLFLLLLGKEKEISRRNKKEISMGIFCVCCLKHEKKAQTSLSFFQGKWPNTGGKSYF